MLLRRSTFFFFLMGCLALAPPAFAQASAGPFVITSASSPCAPITVTGQATVGIKVKGTFSLTLTPEISIQGQAPDATSVTPYGSQTAQATITAAGSYNSAVAAGTTFLLCPTSYASGSATIYLNASTTVAANLLGGGGSGGGVPNPSADGIVVCGTGCSTSSAIAETDGDIIFGALGAWTKGTALPNGVTATTQTPGDSSTDVATDAFVAAAIDPGIGITNSLNGTSFATPFFNSGNAPRLTPTYLATDNTTPTIPTGSDTAELDGWTGMFPDGKFVIVDQTCSNTPCSGAGVVVSGQMRVSSDQGNSWSAPTVILQGSATRTYYCCGGGITNTGRMIVTYNLVLSGVTQGITSIYSDNEGATWSSPALVDSNSTATIYGGTITIGSGYLLSPNYGGANPPWTTSVEISTNNGVSWGSPITVLSSSSACYSEASYAYLGGQTILGVVRCSASSGYYLSQVISTDNGATWTLQGSVPSQVGDSEGSSPWLATFMAPSGRRVVELAYDQRSASQEFVIYGYADALIAGTSGWMLDSITSLGTFPYCQNLAGYNGYQSMVHPYDTPLGIGRYYQYTTADCPATGGTTLVFFTVPTTAALPYDQYFATAIGIGTISPAFTIDDENPAGSGRAGGINTPAGNAYLGDYYGGYHIGGLNMLYAIGGVSNGNLILGSFNVPGLIANSITSASRNFLANGCGIGTGGITPLALTSGSYNAIFGQQSGCLITSGSENEMMGQGNNLAAVTDSYEIVIGNEVSGNGSNTTLIGNPGQTVQTNLAGVTVTNSTCAITSGVSMTVSGTVYTICSWTPAPFAQTLRWSCDGTYSVSTSTDTFAVGMDASADLTTETGNAFISSISAGATAQVQTFGTATATSTGNQTIATGASISSLTAAPFHTWGLVTLTAGSKTFAITGVLTGSSPSGTVNIGTVCNLF
jgi:hypothetical protein